MPPVAAAPPVTMLVSEEPLPVREPPIDAMPPALVVPPIDVLPLVLLPPLAAVLVTVAPPMLAVLVLVLVAVLLAPPMLVVRPPVAPVTVLLGPPLVVELLTTPVLPPIASSSPFLNSEFAQLAVRVPLKTIRSFLRLAMVRNSLQWRMSLVREPTRPNR
jgi:hypothetical protein